MREKEGRKIECVQKARITKEGKCLHHIRLFVTVNSGVREIDFHVLNSSLQIGQPTHTCI